MNIEEAIEKLKETQDSYLKDELDLAIETILVDREITERNYITLTEDVTNTGKQLGLTEDCTIDEIIKRIWALQRENEQLKTALNSSVSKDKIKEKIKTNKSYLEHSNTAYEYTQREVTEEIIRELEELLKERRLNK